MLNNYKSATRFQKVVLHICSLFLNTTFCPPHPHLVYFSRETMSDVAFRLKDLCPQVVGAFYLLETLSSALHPDQLLNCRWLESKSLFYTSVYTWSLKNSKCLWTQKIVLCEKHGYLYCSRGAGYGRAFVIYQSHTFVRAIYSEFVNCDFYRVEATIHIPSYLLQISTPQRLNQRASLILHGLLHEILIWPSVTILMCVHMCV